MSKLMWRIIAMYCLLCFAVFSDASSRWGADYFPDTELVTHEGESVRFFTDLVEDKIVVINFIYTSCPDACPLETAHLTRVQSILGDRLGKDIFFYSISIDPDNDTPAVLKEYRRKFGAKWLFLTGDKHEVIALRRKLGLYIEDNPGGDKNHNVSMIIGNQKTGRWMKRSPFENPYVLADQVGNWLDGWASPPQAEDYANAPELRHISNGEKLFRTRCMSCHTVTGLAENTSIGPDLLGVTKRRARPWLIRWLKEPDIMIQEKDPIAMAMYRQYNEIPMPNMDLTQVDVMDLIGYMSSIDNQAQGNQPDTMEVQEDVVAVMNAWLKESLPEIEVNAGYMTLVNISADPVILVGLASAQFGRVELHEMAMEDGMMAMRELEHIVVPAKGKVQFRPGGKHLMFKQPKASIFAGERIDVTLQFASGKRQSLSVPVKHQ